MVKIKKMTQLKKDRQFLSFPITDIKQKRDMVQLQTHPGMAEALGEEIKSKDLEGLFSVIENDALVLIIFIQLKMHQLLLNICINCKKWGCYVKSIRY